MSYLLKSATLVTFDPPLVEPADLRIQSGRIVDRSTVLEGRDGEEQIDLSGKLIMPGMVCASRTGAPWLKDELEKSTSISAGSSVCRTWCPPMQSCNRGLLGVRSRTRERRIQSCMSAHHARHNQLKRNTRTHLVAARSR